MSTRQTISVQLRDRHRIASVLLIIVVGVTAGSRAAAPAKRGAPASAAIDFRRDIEPILVKRCSECHGPDKQKSDLRLDQKSAALRGGERGKTAIFPGQR